MDYIGTGIVLPGGRRVGRTNNKVWLVSVMLNDQSYCDAYVKIPDDPRCIFVECACALIGREMGLSIPRPMIVQIIPNNSPNMVDTITIGFGSEAMSDYQPFQKFLNADSTPWLEKLKESQQVSDCGAFDEWIANTDRNMGNILIEGRDRFTFIDHELALKRRLSSDSTGANVILDWLKTVWRETEKEEFSNRFDNDIVKQYATICFNSLHEHTHASSYLPGKKHLVDEVIDFLSERISHLSKIIYDRIDIRQGRIDL